MTDLKETFIFNNVKKKRETKQGLSQGTTSAKSWEVIVEPHVNM